MLTPTEEQQLIKLLDKIKPGDLSPDVFHALARVMVVPTVVLIAFDTAKEQVLLTQRSADDPYYAHLWHPPGTVLRPTDESLEAALQRLVDSELPGTTFAADFSFYDVVFEQIERGTEVAVLFTTTVAQHGEGTFFPLDQLPEDIVSTDGRRIEMVIDGI